MPVLCSKWQTEAQDPNDTTQGASSAPRGWRCVSSLSRRFSLGFRDAIEIERPRARKAGFAFAAAFASVLALITSTRAADLVIASSGISQATIVLAPNAGPWEQRAATDL